MSQGDEFKLQGGAAANTEREQGNEGRKNCDHAHDGMAVARKSLAFLNFLSFEQPQPIFLQEPQDANRRPSCYVQMSALVSCIKGRVIIFGAYSNNV